MHRKWYTAAQTGCAGGTACSVSPAELASLANGDYKWRVLDYGAYGYGAFTPYMKFTLNVPVACEDVLYVDVNSAPRRRMAAVGGLPIPRCRMPWRIATSGKRDPGGRRHLLSG